MKPKPVNDTRGDTGRFAEDARFAVEAARWAPSVYNTQPWTFGIGEWRISLRADADRRLDVADPDGREMLISCGAALFNLVLALRYRGYAPRVRLLPEPDRPHLLADVDVTEPAEGPAGPDVVRLYEQVRERRTHRGPFRPHQVPAGLLATLREEARREGAALHVITDEHARAALAALTGAAEHLGRADPARNAEIIRWAPPPHSSRPDGVHAEAYPREPERARPDFPGRDFARGQGWGSDAPSGDAARGAATGVVVLLTTAADTPADWLRAGQAMQRVLLRAHAEEGLSAAFHTQALEFPELREVIRTRLCDGANPQMLLRLGVTDTRYRTVRRPLGELLHQE